MSLMDTVEELLNYLQIPFSFETKPSKFPNPLMSEEWAGKHPYEYVDIKIMGKSQGLINSVHPVLLKNFKIKGNASIAIIDVTDFWTRPQKDKIKYAPISKFPTSTFDCTVLVSKTAPVGELVEVLKKVKVKEIVERKIVDIFELSEEQNAVTLRVTFEDKTKTLDPEVIKKGEDSVVKTLEDAGYPLKQ